jgi:rod shape-determining protein MreC
LLGFLRRNRILLTSAFCLLLAAGLALRTSRERTRTDGLGRVFLEMMAPLQRATSTVRQSVTASWDGVAELFRARGESRRLTAENERLARELDRLTEVELENARLRELLDFRESLHGDLLTARVIGRDATGLSRTLVLGRGESDGVVRGAAVLAPQGIVGHVFQTSAHAARVLLVADHNSGVDALVQRTRARGIVQGTVDGTCGLKYVKRTEDIQVGDTIVTSGLDGIFPKGLPIGKVVSVDKRGQGLFQYAEIAPRVDAEQLEEVMVARGLVAADEPGTTPEPPPVAPAPAPIPNP